MLVNVLSKIVSKLKGQEFLLDKSLSDEYIISFFVAKVVALAWGTIRLCTFKRAFVHPSAKIKCRSKLRFGRNLQVSPHCFIDALSKNGLELGDNCSLGDYTFIRLTGSLKK